MKISVNVSTTREYAVDKDGKPSVSNEGDFERQPENFSYSVVGFNFNGSIDPLAKMIMDWLEDANK